MAGHPEDDWTSIKGTFGETYHRQVVSGHMHGKVIDSVRKENLGNRVSIRSRMREDVGVGEIVMMESTSARDLAVQSLRSVLDETAERKGMSVRHHVPHGRFWSPDTWLPWTGVQADICCRVEKAFRYGNVCGEGSIVVQVGMPPFRDTSHDWAKEKCPDHDWENMVSFGNEKDEAEFWESCGFREAWLAVRDMGGRVRIRFLDLSSRSRPYHKYTCVSGSRVFQNIGSEAVADEVNRLMESWNIVHPEKLCDIL